MKKLTLKADPEVIAQAKRIADESGTSVSALFERFIRLLSRRRNRQRRLPPIARELSGIVSLPRGKDERDLLAEALMEKYGMKK
jgi:Family of unknown function (DUF6364)